MDIRRLCNQKIEEFREYLIKEEKSTVTVEKYLRDVGAFFVYTKNRVIEKEVLVEYKKYLVEQGYAASSINSMLASLNGLMNFLGWQDCKVKNLRMQRKVYCAEEKELTKADYQKLLRASKSSPQINLVMQTICGTGIRVSELQYFTVEAVRNSEVNVRCKSKIRTIFIPGKLKKRLLCYAKKRGIKSGRIFVTKGGNPLDRSNIWSQMKKLCQVAGVNPQKVFPHNLRKLFARTFYGIEKDIAKLADVLGHESIETTRIYIITTGVEHRRQMERMGLII